MPGRLLLGSGDAAAVRRDGELRKRAGDQPDRPGNTSQDSLVRIDRHELERRSTLRVGRHEVETTRGVPCVAEAVRNDGVWLSAGRRHQENAAHLILEGDPPAVCRAGDSIPFPCGLLASEERAWRTASGRNLHDGAVTFHATDINDALAVRLPGRRVRVRGQTSRGASERRHDPQIASVRANVARQRAADANEAGPRRSGRDEGDRVAVRRERRLDVLAGVVRHVDVLAAFSAAHKDVVIAFAVRGIGEQSAVGGPGRPSERPASCVIRASFEIAGCDGGAGAL